MITFDKILAEYGNKDGDWFADGDTLRIDPNSDDKKLHAHTVRTHGITWNLKRRQQQRAAGAQAVKDAIDRQYGLGAGAMVFGHIKKASLFGWRDLNSSVSRGDLGRIDKAIGDLGLTQLSKPVEDAIDFATFYDRTKLTDRRRISGAKVFELIKTDYGEGVARTVFGAIGDADVSAGMAPGTLLAPAQLDQIKQQLDRGDRFSEVYQHFLTPQSDKDGYIRFNTATHEVFRDPLGAGEVDENSFEAFQRQAFGLEVWNMVVEELDEERALKIFQDVFGESFSRTDRAVPMTYKHMDAINAHVKADKILAGDDIEAGSMSSRQGLVSLHHRITDLCRAGTINAERHLDYERLAAMDSPLAKALLAREETGGRPNVMALLAQMTAAQAKEKAAAMEALSLGIPKTIEQNHLATGLAKLVLDARGAFSPQRANALIDLLKSGDLEVTLVPGTRILSPDTHHMIRILTLLRDDPAVRQTLDEINVPHGRGNPAGGMVRATLGLAPEEELIPIHSRQVALGALLTPLRQATGVGSCFATAAVIQVQNGDPERALREVKELIETGALTVTVNGESHTVLMNRTPPSNELEAHLWLDGEGRVTGVGERQLQIPVPLHTVPSIRAALNAMGIPAEDYENVIENALVRFSSQPVNARVVLKVVAISLQNRLASETARGQVRELEREIGMLEERPDALLESKPYKAPSSQERASGLKDVVKYLRERASHDEITLDGLIADEEIKVYQTELANAQRRGDDEDEVKRYEEKLEELLSGHEFKTDDRNAARARLKLGCDAFEAAFDNRLLRSWEYTVAQFAETDSSSGILRNMARAALMDYPSMENPSEGWREIPPLKDSSMRAFFERQLLAWKTGVPFANRVKGVEPSWKPPHIDYRRFITKVDRQVHDPGRELSPETVFFCEMNRAIQVRYEDKIGVRLQTVFEADKGDQGRESPGFALYDAANGRSRAEWRRLDTPRAFQELAASVFMDAAREVLEQDYGHLPQKFRDYVMSKAVEPTAQHVMHPDYEKIADNIVQADYGRSTPPPWARKEGGNTGGLLQNYIGAKHHIRMGPPTVSEDTEISVSDIHSYTLDFASDLAVAFIQDADTYADFERSGHTNHLIPVGADRHAFNMTPFAAGAGENAGKLSDVWKVDKNEAAATLISPALGRTLVSKALNDCGMSLEDLGEFEFKEETVQQLTDRAYQVVKQNALSGPNRGILEEQVQAFLRLALPFQEPSAHTASKNMSVAFRDALDKRAQASLWLTQALQGPGARFAAGKMSVEEQRALLTKVLPSLQVNVVAPLRDKLLNGITEPQTPAALRAHVASHLREDRAQTSMWLRQELQNMGARMTDAKLSVGDQKALLSAVALPALHVSESDPFKDKLLNGVNREQTPAELADFVGSLLDQDRLNSDLEDSLSVNLLSHMETAPPYVMVADLNYPEDSRFSEFARYIALVHNPFNGAIELQQVDIHGHSTGRESDRRRQLEELQWRVYSTEPDRLVGLQKKSDLKWLLTELEMYEGFG